MLICVSLNPAVDKRLRVERLQIGAVNRAREALPMAGGKAAHVAMAAEALGVETVWIGFLGGNTGDAIENELSAMGVHVNSVRVTQSTRTNLEIIDDAGNITEILEPGSLVDAEAIAELVNVCQRVFAASPKHTQVVLSGSLPPGVPVNIYAELIKTAHQAGCRVLLDTSGAALREGLKAGPDLVKPNYDEAAELWGQPIAEGTATLRAAQHFLTIGVGAVALTLGASGVLWTNGKDAPLLAVPPQVEVISTVGCGDATLAGFAVGYERGLSAVATLRLATACGAVNCRAAQPGRIDAAEVARLLPQVVIRGVN